jgi:hypothetical protein
MPEAVLCTLRHVLNQLRARSSSGVLIIHSDETESAEIAETVRASGAGYRRVRSTVNREGTRLSAIGLTTADRRLVETSEILLVVSTLTKLRGDADSDDVIAYGHGIGRSVIQIDSETGVLDGSVPEQIQSEQGWLPELFEMAGLTPDADLETIKARMSALANKSAPLTRAKWNWIVFVQGLAVCVPLGWLLGWPITLVGVTAFTTTLILVGLHWWLRYRSMQKIWARARLVAETARSLIATCRYAAAWPWQTLATVPSLRPLRWAAKPPSGKQSFSDWLNGYVENRIAVQEKYFTEKQEEAEKQRKKLTWWTTLLLDLALLFAVAGLIIVFTPRGAAWMVGGSFAQAVLGSISILILLGLLLIQVVRELQEVNRRTARFAQQQLVLQDAKTRLRHIQSQELTLEVIADTESKLLAEVLEWYFHAETAERFVELKEPTKRALTARFFRRSGSISKMVHAIPARIGKAGLFILGVIVGRLPFVVAGVAAVVMWIYYWLPEQGADFKKLEDTIELFGKDDRSLFDPRFEKTTDGQAQADKKLAYLVARAEHGYVVLVHGLYGRGLLTGESKEDQRNWMKPCARCIEERMPGDAEPAICLVNWSEAAMPSKFYHRVFGERSFLADIPAIRAQAYRVGDIVAFKLAGVILGNNLPRNVPLHLIGHSAGGFVVTRIARRLCELGLTDESMVHVTILDTPAPDKEITETLPEFYPNDAVDFYISSDLGGRLPTLQPAKFSPKIHSHTVAMETEAFPLAQGVLSGLLDRLKKLYHRSSNMWEAHRHSYEWFMETIDDPKDHPGEGFNRSSLLTKNQQASQP